MSGQTQDRVKPIDTRARRPGADEPAGVLGGQPGVLVHEDRGAGKALGSQVGQSLVGLVERVEGHRDLELQPLRQAQEFLRVATRVNRDAAHLAFLK